MSPASSASNACTRRAPRRSELSRSSTVRPVVSTGSPIRTRIVTGRTTGLPLRIAARPPVTATGTTGACAWMAMMKPPFLKGSRASVRLRVPSGKIRNELPARSDSAPRAIEANDCSGSRRSTGTNPPTCIARPSSGSLESSAL